MNYINPNTPDFGGSASTGIQWVLHFPGGSRVNTSLRFCFLCFDVSAVGLIVLVVCWVCVVFWAMLLCLGVSCFVM